MALARSVRGTLTVTAPIDDGTAWPCEKPTMMELGVTLNAAKFEGSAEVPLWLTDDAATPCAVNCCDN